MFRKLITLLLLGFWLSSVGFGFVKNVSGDEPSRQQLVSFHPLTVVQALGGHDHKQKPSLTLSPGSSVPDFGAARVWSSPQGEKSEHSKRSLKIYELNRVLLI